MQGKFLRLAQPPSPRSQVRLRLATDVVAWDLIAPATCELLDDGRVAALVGGLGPDPLRPDAEPDRAWEGLRCHPGPVGAALLDQSVIAGVGNVFRAEALFATGIAPTRPTDELGRTEFDALWRTLRSMMQWAVDEGRIITVETEPERARNEVSEDEGRHVYRQARCRRCGTPVTVSDVGRRSAYACPRCRA
jgi:endonuclease-8